MRSRPLVLMLLAAFLFIGGIGSGSSLAIAGDLQTSSQPGDTITMKIDGWTCASCEKDVHAALIGVSGVQSAQVSYPSGGAIVQVEPGQVSADQLVQAIRGASNVFDTYQARIIPNGSLTIEQTEGSGFWNSWSSLFN
jgi:copper chaperone CopZ